MPLFFMVHKDAGNWKPNFKYNNWIRYFMTHVYKDLNSDFTYTILHRLEPILEISPQSLKRFFA